MDKSLKNVLKVAPSPSGTLGNNFNIQQRLNQQLTIQSIHGLQPGQQGAVSLKTENRQYQLVRVGPVSTAANINSSQVGGQPVTFRMSTVPSKTGVSSGNNSIHAGGTTVRSTAQQPVQHSQIRQVQVQRPANDISKEKCRQFLANILELASEEPATVERNVRTLIQDLIDNKVEPEIFCDQLVRLLNASPQPCLIGFLKKSLPLLRHSLATQELSIDGIRPMPANVLFSIAGVTVQTVHPAIPSNQVRSVPPGSTVLRPGQVLQQRLVAPIGAQGQQQQTRMVTTIRQPNISNNVIVSSSQPPALHSVYPNSQQIKIRTAVPLQKQPMGVVKFQGMKPSVPSNVKPTAKDKEKSTFSSAFTGDDDINDVTAMGGVNLAEETQKILGSTKFVGTQIRSCKEDMLCSMSSLKQKIRQIMMKHGLDEPNTDVAACISHAAEERLRNLLEKMSDITKHRPENVQVNQRYEITTDVKGQLKFIEDLDRAERKRHEEVKQEDPQQAELKVKAKEMQRVEEMEKLRQREANATAEQDIRPRKKPRLDGEHCGISQASVNGSNTGARGQMPLRQRMKKVTLRDFQFLGETDKDLRKSTLLYKSYLK